MELKMEMLDPVSLQTFAVPLSTTSIGLQVLYAFSCMVREALGELFLSLLVTLCAAVARCYRCVSFGISYIICWLKSDSQYARLCLLIPEIAGYAFGLIWCAQFTDCHRHAYFGVALIVAAVKVAVSIYLATRYHLGPWPRRPFGRWARTIAAVLFFVLTHVIAHVSYHHYDFIFFVLTLVFFTNALLLRVADDLGFFGFLCSTTSSVAAVKVATSKKPSSFEDSIRIWIPISMLVIGGTAHLDTAVASARTSSI